MDIKKIGIVIGAAVVCALGTWVIMNWIPSTTILIASVAGGYLAWTKVN